MWMGETPKNVAAVFRLARQEQAVLFFDEADAIASRRSTSVDHGFQRESNTVVNVLLQELERFNGVVIFATNLAANFDPAFERRIRTHVLFEMPGVDEREQIWRVQMHPTLTPLADDVDFRKLAETYEVSGGDIRNAVLESRAAAATSPQHDTLKLIHHHHFDEGIRDVVAGKKVMQQSLFDKTAADMPHPPLHGLTQAGHVHTVRVSSGVACGVVALLRPYFADVRHRVTESQRNSNAETQLRVDSDGRVAAIAARHERRKHQDPVVQQVLCLRLSCLAVRPSGAESTRARRAH